MIVRTVLYALSIFLFLTSTVLAAELPGVREKFRPYAESLVETLVMGTERFAKQVRSGNLAAAKRAWILARPSWERGETFLGEFFEKYDEAIDSWPDAKKGFHAIEAKLFRGDLKGSKHLTEELLKNIKNLRTTFRKTPLTTQGLLNGMASLAFEIGEGKSKGGESPFSGTSLFDMQNNAEGLEILYAVSFGPYVKKKNATLHVRILSRIWELRSALTVSGIKKMDQRRVAAVSERLAGDFQDAARLLGLEKPKLGD